VIGLDTNILIRFLANDDPVQSPRAMELLRSLNEENPGFQSLVVLAEMVWVLRRRFRASRQDVVRYVEIMLNSNGLVIENSLVVRQALLRFEGGRRILPTISLSAPATPLVVPIHSRSMSMRREMRE